MLDSKFHNVRLLTLDYNLTVVYADFNTSTLKPCLPSFYGCGTVPGRQTKTTGFVGNLR